MALINNPNVLILDEPTNGLDPEGMKELRELLRKLAVEANIAILISSHNLSEIENLCTKISIIKNGKILETTSTDEFKTENILSRYCFKVANNIDSELRKKIINDIIDITENKEEDIDFKFLSQNSFTINIVKENIPKVIRLMSQYIDIYEVSREKQTLEDAFISKTGGNKIV